jgi:hypothetical protein
MTEIFIPGPGAGSGAGAGSGKYNVKIDWIPDNHATGVISGMTVREV